MKPILLPNSPISDLLSPLDWMVFTATILFTFLVVLYGNFRKKTNRPKTSEDSFLDLILMGRQLTLPLFVGTMVATWYGGIFGVTTIAFEKGIFNFVTQGLFWYGAYIIFALCLVDKIAHYRALTLPDLIGKMFGPKSGKLAGIFNFFNVLPIAYVISLGLFGQALFGGELWQSMSIGVAFVLLYSTIGGFRSIVYTDMLQFFVMCSSVLLVLIIAISTFGGYQFLKSSLPATHFEPTGGEGIATTMVWGFIALSTLIDPNFYQRCFAAKSPKVAKKGILISTVIWFCFDICTTFGAMYAKAVIPSANPKNAYLLFSTQILPIGLKGFFLAGILATILSTLDSYLFLAGTTLSYDLCIDKWKKNIWVHRIGIIFVGLISIIMALSFKGDIKQVWKTLGSYSSSCLLLPVMVGYIFPGKISDLHFIFSSCLGILATTYWKNANRPGFAANIDELYVGILATTVGLLLGALYKFKNKTTQGTS